ncbi:manganese-binding transcriptional regulator MntR [Estrella lausannensis]|uniref:Transcriptional regulator MntR n=1 Tax=Estrella lausannensis TaxID=483423 RepID=A0A0H5DMR9_9BACT|nr:manganese-binding transcriptional regulator MntR [Estrella lausannensis]CRX37446.1 Transcriptional regulator [Estrella lausannensis]
MKKKQSRAKAFIETRKQHLAEIAEDYVEIVFDLIEQKGEARTCDIAKQLGVSHVTVIRTVKRLESKGLFQTESHKPVRLTEKGLELASFSKKKHEFLLQYLLLLGVPEEIARIDVEGMEHHISEETLKAFQTHFQKIQGCLLPPQTQK